MFNKNVILFQCVLTFEYVNVQYWFITEVGATCDLSKGSTNNTNSTPIRNDRSEIETNTYTAISTSEENIPYNTVSTRVAPSNKSNYCSTIIENTDISSSSVADQKASTNISEKKINIHL